MTNANTANAGTATTPIKNKWEELQETVAIARQLTELENAKSKQARQNAGLPELPDYIFVPAVSKKVVTKTNVLVRIPGANAKYLKEVGQHRIIAFSDFDKKSLSKIRVPAHYRHGDFPRKVGEKTLPFVWRHFFVDPEFLGKDIVADVTISTKRNLLTGETEILIDIIQVKSNQAIEVSSTLRMGADPTGSPDEVIIPGYEKCIRIEPIRPRLVLV
jgi:hypothetical protein